MTPTRCHPVFMYSVFSRITANRVECQQREPCGSSAVLDLRHPRAADALPTGAPMHEQFCDVGAMWLIRRPRRMQRHAAGNAEFVTRDEDDGSRVGLFERRSPPLARFADRQRTHEVTPAPLSTASTSSRA